MTTMIGMKFEGGRELAAALSGLSDRLSKSILRDALRVGGEPIRKSASAHAPRRAPAPDLADNIVMSNARTDDMVGVNIGPARGFAYALPLEYGTVHMSAQPFMRPAFDENLDRSLKIISAELWGALVKRGAISSTRTAGGGGGLL